MTALSNVDLPAPLGPITETICPGPTVELPVVKRLDLAVTDRQTSDFEELHPCLISVHPAQIRFQHRRIFLHVLWQSLPRSGFQIPSPPAGQSDSSRNPCRALPAGCSCLRPSGGVTSRPIVVSPDSADLQRAHRVIAKSDRSTGRERSPESVAVRAPDCRLHRRDAFPAQHVDLLGRFRHQTPFFRRIQPGDAAPDARLYPQVRANRDVLQHRHARQQLDVLESPANAAFDDFT